MSRVVNFLVNARTNDVITTRLGTSNSVEYNAIRLASGGVEVDEGAAFRVEACQDCRCRGRVFVNEIGPRLDAYAGRWQAGVGDHAAFM